MSVIITCVLVIIVGMIIVSEMRCGRRNKAFHEQLDPQVTALTDRVVAKYREKYGKDPTMQHPIVEAPKERRSFFSKKA